MPRFYLDHALEIGTHCELPEDLSHHIGVLRLKAGDTITLFNGRGGEFNATLSLIEKRSVTADVKTFDAREAEPGHALTLAQALPEGSKMDWVIEKAVELGVTAIQPLIAARSVVRLNDERANKKLMHWRSIVASAAAQCGRNRLPSVAMPQAFSSWIDQHDLHPRIVLSPRGRQSLTHWAKHRPPQAITLIIGPEGGLSETEEQAAVARGALCLSMGSRVLRTETAGIAAMAALHALWGEF
nr:16S rRNA (uracil(1498)-N(3))-methyltransferase [Oxalobacteraceae bacterium]